MQIATQGGTIRIGLLPEARGQRLRFGTMSDLRPGSTVTIVLDSAGKTAVPVEE